MDWSEILTKVFELILFPLLSLGTGYLVAFIDAKMKQVKQHTKNETVKKYLTMLDTTIINCVLATQQTYVEALKKEGKFDAEAQKKALRLTYQNITATLSVEAQDYLREAVGDLEKYITNGIEANIQNNKKGQL